MSDFLVQAVPELREATLPTGFVERRRPGRIDNASPELISLMRNPASKSARMRVALYDAPGFLLPTAPPRSRPSSRSFGRLVVAMMACSAASTAAFKVMLIAWG